eukprot:609645-Alexandrium_andersonii.AAC.1
MHARTRFAPPARTARPQICSPRPRCSGEKVPLEAVVGEGETPRPDACAGAQRVHSCRTAVGAPREGLLTRNCRR